MKTTINRFLRSLFDAISPRVCVICGRRLTIDEEVLCIPCYANLPRTWYDERAEDNELARLFWGRVPIERAVALCFYQSHSYFSRLIYMMKYKNHPDAARYLGRIMAEELLSSSFFEGIDALVPVPITRRRRHQRGYNQSMEIALGVSRATGLPVIDKALVRTSFTGSQTKLGRLQRQDNVEKVFHLVRPQLVAGLHVLVIDDIVTTGATIVSCMRELRKAEGTRLSLLAAGFTKN